MSSGYYHDPPSPSMGHHHQSQSSLGGGRHRSYDNHHMSSQHPNPSSSLPTTPRYSEVWNSFGFVEVGEKRKSSSSSMTKGEKGLLLGSSLSSGIEGSSSEMNPHHHNNSSESPPPSSSTIDPSSTPNGDDSSSSSSSSHGDLGGYPMKRTKSSLFFDEPDDYYMPSNYKLLDNRIALLQRELLTMKRKMDVFEEDKSKTNKWGVKYTRRFTLVSNIALGLFVFMSRFLRRIQQRKNKIIQNMMVPNATTSDTFNTILNEAYIQSIAKSWYFFVSAICLASDTAWKRNVGITVSTVASAWPILKNRNAWAHYLSLLASAAYVFAEWASAERKDQNVKTLRDFIGPWVDPHHHNHHHHQHHHHNNQHHNGGNHQHHHHNQMSSGDGTTGAPVMVGGGVLMIPPSSRDDEIPHASSSLLLSSSSSSSQLPPQSSLTSSDGPTSNSLLSSSSLIQHPTTELSVADLEDHIQHQPHQ